MDVFNTQKRSEIMSKVKSKGNKSTEMKLVEFFKATGIKGWRRHYDVIGKPDFAFPKRKIAVFADGCFWHGHDCRNTTPKQNAEFWTNKINKNRERDTKVCLELTKKGWTVIRIWECYIKKNNFPEYFRYLLIDDNPIK